jgi:hypothetical protein
MEMDVRSMEFANNEYDLVIDKALFDTICVLYPIIYITSVENLLSKTYPALSPKSLVCSNQPESIS